LKEYVVALKESVSLSLSLSLSLVERKKTLKKKTLKKKRGFIIRIIVGRRFLLSRGV
jgi:hypothetical protein